MNSQPSPAPLFESLWAAQAERRDPVRVWLAFLGVPLLVSWAGWRALGWPLVVALPTSVAVCLVGYSTFRVRLRRRRNAAMLFGQELTVPAIGTLRADEAGVWSGVVPFPPHEGNVGVSLAGDAEGPGPAQRKRFQWLLEHFAAIEPQLLHELQTYCSSRGDARAFPWSLWAIRVGRRPRRWNLEYHRLDDQPETNETWFVEMIDDRISRKSCQPLLTD
jgi:hypothetical protein